MSIYFFRSVLRFINKRSRKRWKLIWECRGVEFRSPELVNELLSWDIGGAIGEIIFARPGQVCLTTNISNRSCTRTSEVTATPYNGREMWDLIYGWCDDDYNIDLRQWRANTATYIPIFIARATLKILFYYCATLIQHYELGMGKLTVTSGQMNDSGATRRCFETLTGCDDLLFICNISIWIALFIHVREMTN